MLCRYLSILLITLLRVVVGDDELNHVLSFQNEKGLIEVNDYNYESLSTIGIEGYYSILFITMRGVTSNGRKCEMCLDFEDTLENVYDAVKSQHPNLNVLFYVADTNENSKLVRDLKLQSVPHLLVYPPTTHESSKNFSWLVNQFYQYELKNIHAKDVMRFADFLGKTMNILVLIQEPFDTNAFSLYFIICMAFFIIIKRVILPRVTNKAKFFCFFLIFGIMLPSLTGYKFTQIKGIPFIARGEDGKIMFFSGGTSWQFGIEIFTMSMLYLLLSLEIYALITLPTLEISPKNKILYTSVLACILFYSTQYYMQIYAIKSPGYPFMF
ncbi:hypothetical protein TPHA_0D02510 [Tetrapisispora phaffii CBS 4417]|uniref:Dolichyl-diphosphooligosaccharide--protein glycosyltransferase subunit OST6 n=1 Tax=Tetrapisispora phaffii (strain ATCC 24235 / CBS 4417 / NBRC 1672 / NRRL Y-8282 / UCD 70-5) TaxID=1071381 RepID=G8BSR7_TETPH|nr:hypothetical protein TPHA_0D02510 [Tetrapisispora phaffii CBS 4417]CCE62888.1 hypothetical protein TPHA_0D02510 [Tetrapisispora phaffii CBS 4417]